MTLPGVCVFQKADTVTAKACCLFLISNERNKVKAFEFDKCYREYLIWYM